MKDKVFKGTGKTSLREGDIIAVGIATDPKIPYISFGKTATQTWDKKEIKNSSGCVHFRTKKEWDEFKAKLEDVEREAVFIEEYACDEWGYRGW